MTDVVMPEVAVQMSGIRKSFAGVEVLHGVDFDVAPGEVHALAGENGAGKSTLMKILSGDQSSDDGTIEVAGERMTFRSPAEAQAAGIAMINQELSYVPRLTVAENLFLGSLPVRRCGIVSMRSMREDADTLLSSMGFEVDSSVEMAQLSLGARQIVEILRAVRRQARVVVMDEPTSSLNAAEVKTLFDIIQRLRAAGTSVIYISHHLDELFAVADKVTVLRDGNVVSSLPVANTSSARLVADMVGETAALGGHRPAGDRSSGEVRLEIESLSVDGALLPVDLTLRANEVVGIYGLAGAGQEHLVRSLYGLEPSRQGTIRLDGKVVRLRSPREAVAEGIGFVPGDRKVDGIIPKRGVRENMTYPSLDRLSRLGVVRRAPERDAVRDAFTRLGIHGDPGQAINSLSGGNQQKAIVARWLVKPTRVLVLADPTRGVDVRAKGEIHRALRALAVSGVPVLMASSDLPELADLCDRILVMRRGACVARLEGTSTSEQEILQFAAGGGINQ
jgi:ABC-type sugar transport system ATPase subunit